MRSGTLMIGIAGGTGSGKTTLVRKLGERFGSSVSVVCHDWYYRAQNGLSLEERARQNYDRPERPARARPSAPAQRSCGRLSAV